MDRGGGEGSILLDIIADEVTNITDSSENSLIINISDEKLEAKIFEVLSNNKILSNSRSDIRNMCKFGDFSYLITNMRGERLFSLDADKDKRDKELQGTKLKMAYNPNDIQIHFLHSEFYGVDHSSQNIYELKVNNTDKYGTNVNVKDEIFYPWEYSLFSIKSRDSFPYGLSELEKMRTPWEKLTILEELLALTRSNRMDKIAVTVPGLKGDPTSVLNRLSQLKNTIKNIILGSGSGDRISRNRDTGLTEYLWVPEGFDLKKLSSAVEVASIEDVEYFRDKLINASRLPKGFFIAGESAQARPLSLRQQDIKFARSLIPIGEAYCSGLQKLITLVAFYLGADITQLEVEVKFKKSPYISSELMNTYKDIYSIIKTYKDTKSEFSETKEITDVDVKRILDLIGAPHVIFFPEEEGKPRNKIYESINKKLSYGSLLELSQHEITKQLFTN
jgi:hypothetical protein